MVNETSPPIQINGSSGISTNTNGSTDISTNTNGSTDISTNTNGSTDISTNTNGSTDVSTNKLILNTKHSLGFGHSSTMKVDILSCFPLYFAIII
ncbi:hypothetical protein M8J77_019330 [Diaphorina citri]|nr:hypothetical protein M8J77_019330 [Diaphorina citri]